MNAKSFEKTTYIKWNVSDKGELNLTAIYILNGCINKNYNQKVGI